MKSTEEKKLRWIRKNQLVKLIEENENTIIMCKEIQDFPTRVELAKSLHNIFYVLKSKLKFQITYPKNLKVKHLNALVLYWYREGKPISEINSRLRDLNILCHWLNKVGMVKSAEHYLKNFGTEIEL